MSLFEQLKEKLKEFYLNTKYKFDSNFLNNLIDKLPSEENIDDYYYDFLNDKLVPKKQLGVPIERVDRNIDNLLQSPKYKPIENTITVESANDYQVQHDFNGNFYNTIIVEVRHSNPTTPTTSYYYDIWLDIYRSISYPESIMQENVVDYASFAVRKFTFEPVDKLEINFDNRKGEFDVIVNYTFTYSENPEPINNYLAGRVGTSTTQLPYSAKHNHQYYNGMIIYFANEGATTLNLVITAISKFGTIFTRTITTGTSYYEKIDLDPTHFISVTITNNHATSKLTFRFFFFFSNLGESVDYNAELGIGEDNKRWKNCILEWVKTFDDIYGYSALGNQGANDTDLYYAIPLDYIIGSHNLVITKIKVGIYTADANDYVTAMNLIAWSDHNSQTTPRTDGTNLASSQTKIYDITDLTIGGVYEKILIHLDCVCTDMLGLSISFVQIEYYYTE